MKTEAIERGLTSVIAGQRLKEFGPNVAVERRSHPLLKLISKFWAPVPCMLEVTIVVEVLLHRISEAVIIAILLLFNAALGFIQENRAQSALELLRRRLSVRSRVLRDGQWRIIEAESLVPGDVVHVRMGDIMPADVRIASGLILLDQSALTGESIPVDAGADRMAFAGTIVKRGEATGFVTATGRRTVYGKTAELVQLAKTRSQMQYIIFNIVKYLVALDVLLVAAVLFYAWLSHIPASAVLPFALILLVASIPVALPATYTVATALGSLELAREGVLVTRLAAIEEAAAMDVLFSDKTGTITQNQLAVMSVLSYPPYTEPDVLRMAVIASDEATQDPIDLAIISAYGTDGSKGELSHRLRYIPFDPATKRSEAFLTNGSEQLRVVKGAPAVVRTLCEVTSNIDDDVSRLARQGARVLAVAVGAGRLLRLAGLIALYDPPRDDSKELMHELRHLGVRIVMVTGDGPETAISIADRIGLGTRVCPADEVRKESLYPLDYDIFASVLPEDKFRLVKALQGSHHTTGMTGDGVNDAPALKQAEVGIAVASATDVAKAAASLVLTTPGLSNIISAVKASRRIHQRMLTYTLNKIIKTIEIAFLASLGLILTGNFVTTPTLIVLLLFTNDFVTMSIATDRVAFAATPQKWKIGTLILAALCLGLLVLGLSFGILFVVRNVLHFPLGQIHTLIFITLVFNGQGTVYLVRERRHFWQSRPSKWMLISSIADIIVVTFLATTGTLMTKVGVTDVLALLVVISAYLIILDFLKVRLLKKVLQL